MTESVEANLNQWIFQIIKNKYLKFNVDWGLVVSEKKTIQNCVELRDRRDLIHQ